MPLFNPIQTGLFLVKIPLNAEKTHYLSLVELSLYKFYQTGVRIQSCTQTPQKHKQINLRKIQKYSKYEIQKDAKIQSEIISQSKVIDGKAMIGRAVKEVLSQNPSSKQGLYKKGHFYICNKRPEAKGRERKLKSDTSISANVMSFNC